MSTHTTVTLELENKTDRDYREVRIVAMAWDSNGLPVKLSTWSDSEYVIGNSMDNLTANSISQMRIYCQNVEIAYMSVFLSRYVDYDDNEWENPLWDYIDDSKGEKLEDTILYYYEMEDVESNSVNEISEDSAITEESIVKDIYAHLVGKEFHQVGSEPTMKFEENTIIYTWGGDKGSEVYEYSIEADIYDNTYIWKTYMIIDGIEYYFYTTDEYDTFTLSSVYSDGRCDGDYERID